MDPVSIHPQSTERFFDRLAAVSDPGSAKPAGDAATSNLERLQECYRAIARADFAAVAALTADDVEMELTGPPLVPIAGHWRGRTQVDAATRANYAALADQRAELLALTATGNDVVVFAREQGRVRASGVLYDILWSQQYTFKEGLISRIRGVLAAPFRAATEPGQLGDA